jgi:tetratricopeptide (TPR) repeat protein
MIVAWRSGNEQGVCKMGNIALGGIFLNTPTPAAAGAVLDLIFEIAAGTHVRARAMVRSSRIGQGMGVKFVHMLAEDRSRLNQFLKLQIAAGNVESDLRTEDGQVARPRVASEPKAAAVSGVRGSREITWQLIVIPAEKGARAVVDAPTSHEKASRKEFDSQQPAPAKAGAQQAQSAANATSFEQELQRYVAILAKSTHYGLLGIAGDCDKAGIKQSFRVLARKFHPDRHMNSPQCAAALQQLMGAITEAYGVLSHEETRATYDRKLAYSQMRTEEEENTDQCFRLATNCQRSGNGAGAIFWFRKCVNLSPEVGKYHVALAASLATLNHFRRDAVEHFQRAIELDQWDPLAYLQLGKLYEDMQLPWRAGPLYSKVLEMDPGHIVARQRLGAIDNQANKKVGLATASLFSKKR